MKRGPRPLPPTSLSHDALLRGIKIVDIGYITVIYFMAALGCAMLYDAILGEFDEEAAKQKSIVRLLAELALHLWTMGVLIYVARNLVELIPFPLDGMAGFQHARVKELTNASIFSVVILMFSEHLKAKAKHVYQRLFTKKNAVV
jgi:hypothetical protein